MQLLCLDLGWLDRLEMGDNVARGNESHVATCAQQSQRILLLAFAEQE